MSSTLRPVTSGMTPAEVSWTLMPLVTTPLPRSMVWYQPNASAWACNSAGVVTARERSERGVAPNVGRVTRPVPPQVIPRPADWRPGGPPPWAGLPPERRASIGLDRVLDALDAAGQAGAVPDDVGKDGIFEAPVVGETPAPSREVNAGVLAVIFEEDGEARVVLTRRSTRAAHAPGPGQLSGRAPRRRRGRLRRRSREAYEEVGLDPAWSRPWAGSTR